MAISQFYNMSTIGKKLTDGQYWNLFAHHAVYLAFTCAESIYKLIIGWLYNKVVDDDKMINDPDI